MEQFEVDDSSLTVNLNKKPKKEKKSKKISFNLIAILCLIVFSIIFIFVYLNSLKLIQTEKQKNDELKQIVEGLIKERNQTQTTIDKLIKWKEDKEKNKEEKVKNQIDSKIIYNQDAIFISDRLTDKDYSDRKVIFNLVYRASRDGANAQSYHSKCDGKINTVTVVQTVKGSKFGGYTETQIQDGNIGYKDPNSFIFSLNKMKIYENLNKDNNVIRHYRDNGPYFVGGFVIYDSNFNDNNSNYVCDKTSSFNFFSDNEKEYEINNGEKYFHIKELEVFEIFLE
jgi:cell division protein FtsI/penicillin-binding protein 2